MQRVNLNQPWRTLESLLQNSLGLGRDFDRMLFGPAHLDASSTVGWPQFNIWTNDDELIVTAEIPGFEADQIEIDINNNQLTVSASVESAELADEQSFQRRERFSGKFERTLKLPFAVDQEKSEASYIAGVLEIRLAKPERDKPRKLAIKAG